MAHPFTKHDETAPMIACVWGTALSPTVAALIVERQHLGHRFSLAPRRVLHALSAFISHALEQDMSASEIAADVDRRDIRDLLACAIPIVHPRLFKLLDRCGEHAKPLAFYKRINEFLHGPASSLLLESEIVDEACLQIVEELVAEPVLLAARRAIGRSQSNLRLLRSVIAFLRATGLSLDAEQLPAGSGWRSIQRRLSSDLGRGVAPPLPCRCPDGWRQVTKLSDLFKLGRDLENCVAGVGGGGEHHLVNFITGEEFFLVSDSAPPALTSVQSAGPTLWIISQMAVGRGRPETGLLLGELRTAMRAVLTEAGHTLLEITPTSAIQSISYRAERAVELGEDEDLDDAA